MNGRIELQAFCEIVQGGRHGFSGNHFVEVGFPAYGAGGMNGFLATFEFERPAVVLSSIGALCGKCFYADGKWSSLANTQVIFPDPERADARFLWYQLNDETRWHRSGTAQPFIKPSDVKAHRVYLPALPDQQRIAAILDQADALRAKRRQALAKLDTLAQSLFLDLFGDPRTNPKGWPEATIGEVTPFISSGSTPLGGSSVYQSSGILFIRSQNVMMNAVDFSDAAYISEETHRKMKRTWVKSGDVLINITGASIGRVHYFSGEDNTANVNQYVCIIRTDRKKILPAFLSRFLSIPSYQAQIVGQNSGATRQAFNFAQIRQFNIFLPPIDLQAEFVRREKSAVKLGTQLSTSSGKLDALFASLQHRAFCGEL